MFDYLGITNLKNRSDFLQMNIFYYYLFYELVVKIVIPNIVFVVKREFSIHVTHIFLLLENYFSLYKMAFKNIKVLNL